MFVYIIYVVSTLVVSSLAKECGLADLSKENSFPWSVNIYEAEPNTNEYTFLCSGTALSSKLLLTAASCFSANESKTKKFFINVGQKYKNWNSRLLTQEISINNLTIPQKYIKGKYSNNIAIIRLGAEKKVDIRQPVCINWDNEYLDLSDEANSPQFAIAVWHDDKNTAYQIFHPSFLELDLCKYYLSATKKQQYLTYDKFCLELEGVNNVPTLGSGVYVLNKNTNRWYLIGITSEVTRGSSSIYISYIKINTHLNWLSNVSFLDL
ncbi:hypothetical protein RN001_005411 [Aquatica leii]|uniref:Peptidase S1 domain-containing protein n=1 Tax=Aquatica leii TaxID=1421715 RepID=A0AAN7SHV2_9COLE|nr:hypothetical protein RN001_005411 [Aquatica leii]